MDGIKMGMSSTDRWLECYDYKKSWEDNKTGWYESSIQVGFIDANDGARLKYQNIIDWIYINIQECERHARWCYGGYYRGYITATAPGYLYAKFRYERDFLWFQLTWQ
jgi:hypothetical protein